jgi:GT2 family glycosyltransferase
VLFVLATVLSTVLTVLLAVTGCVVALLALYQLALAGAAFFYRPPRGDGAGRPVGRVAIVVPAHDEATVITRCVRSLLEQEDAPERYDVVVVADNCTDDTAGVARAAGADVLVRDDPSARGKGHALRWAFERLMAGPQPPDAVAVVDADSNADPRFLASLLAPFERGADAAQGESLLEGEASAGAAFRAAAFLLVNRVRPAGRAVLGLPCHLAGNGMLFSREALAGTPWGAFTSAEDAEYAIQLRLNGVAPVFAGGAILWSPAAPSAAAAKEQQLRWEGGKIHLARTRIPELLGTAVRKRRLDLVDAALELAMPPLGLLAAAAMAGAVLAIPLAATGVVGWAAAVPWIVALLAVPLYVLVGLRAARAPGWAYRALLRTPVFLVTKAFALGRTFRFRGDTWVRTVRAEEEQGRDPDGDDPGRRP